MTSQPVKRTGRVRGRPAFTLVEMVVAVGIIVVLAALTITASVALVERTEVRETEDIIRLLDVALQEWESESERRISWGVEDFPWQGAGHDMFDAVPHVYTLAEVLARIGDSDQVKTALAQIKPERIYKFDTNLPAPIWITRFEQNLDPNAQQAEARYNANDLNGRPITGMLTVLDAWDNPIRAVHPGRRYEPAAPFFDTVTPDADGTVHLDLAFSEYGVEELYGRAENRRILFVSAGPDGRFGNLGADEGTDLHEQAHDNVYSYRIADEAHDE